MGFDSRPDVIKNVNNMAATYSSVVRASKSNDPESSDGLSGVKPVFILERDILGGTKPQPKDFLNHTKLYKAIDQTVLASHLKWLLRVNGLWRIYPGDQDARDTLLTQGITLRKRLISVYARNPKVVVRENQNT